MFDLFYVESPLQLLTAIKARDELAHNPVLIIKLGKNTRKSNNQQIMALINPNDWSRVHFINESNQVGALSELKYLLTTLQLHLRYKAKIRRYFFGELRNIYMAILGKSLKPQELILLDDGAFTITAQLHFIKNNILPYNHKHQAKVTKLYNFLLGIDLDKFDVPNLYSFFNFDGLMIDGQVNYHKDNQKRNIKIESNDVYFFGSKFAEAGILSEETELLVIEKTFKLYPNKKVHYIPHRDEHDKKLERVIQLGGQILNLGGPAENFFDSTEVMPEIVVACYSTVLYSCFARFSNVKTVAIDIRPLLLLESIKNNVENVYRYYKKTGITVENVHPIAK
jgi:hypothetical protein